MSSNSTTKNSWTWIVLSAAVVALGVLILGAFVLLPPVGIVLALFLFGFLAGAVAGRQAWLAGTLVGGPLVFQQLTRHALASAPPVASLADPHAAPLAAVWMSPDFWWIAGPVSFTATGLAVMGALAGAWLRGTRRTA